jgi:hypothetical protein
MTTTAGEQRIRECITSRGKELAFIKIQLLEEQERLKNCKSAITNLELYIPAGKKILQSHEENYRTFLDIKTRKADIKGLLSLPVEPEPTSEALLRKLRNCALIDAYPHDEVIETKVRQLGKDIRVLWDKIRHLEMELEGWKFSEQLSKSAITCLNSTKISLEEAISTAKSAFRSMWKVPDDIWATVFKLVVDAEFNDYVKQNDGELLRPTVFALSHICYRWRCIVRNERRLWTVVYLPHREIWKIREYDRLANSISKAGHPMTILVNISPDRSWPEFLVHDEDDIRFFDGESFSIHVTMDNDDEAYLERMAFIPLSQASAVILSAIRPIEEGHLFIYLHIPAATHLTIINDNPIAIPSLTELEPIPSLTSLTFRVKEFPETFEITSYLLESLEELYILQGISGSFPALEAGIQLPKVHTLGITPAAAVLLKNVEMARLRTLILHGSDNPDENIQAAEGDAADQAYRRLIRLEFRDWGNYDGGNTNAGAVSWLEKTMSKMQGLQSIKFTDSFINGAALATFMDDAMRNNSGSMLKSLNEVTLSRVSGITRKQCDVLVELVPKLNIYV